MSESKRKLRRTNYLGLYTEKFKGACPGVTDWQEISPALTPILQTYLFFMQPDIIIFFF